MNRLHAVPAAPLARRMVAGGFFVRILLQHREKKRCTCENWLLANCDQGRYQAPGRAGGSWRAVCRIFFRASGLLLTLEAGSENR